jgi:two-component system LytT family response regulator
MSQVLRSPHFVPPAPPVAPRAASVPEPLGRMLVKTDDRLLVVRMEEVDWIESAGNYVRLHAGGRAHVVRQTLGGLAARLDPRRFVRVHRTAVVNLDSILELLFGGGKRSALKLRDGSELPVSRRFRRGLLARVGRA